MPQCALKYTCRRRYFTQTAKTVQYPIAGESTLYRENVNTGGGMRSHSQHTTLFAATIFTVCQRTDNFKGARKHSTQSMKLQPINRMRLAVGVNDRPCSRLAPRNGDMGRTHPSLKGRRKPLAVDHHELFTHQVARKLCTICVQVGALVGSDRD